MIEASIILRRCFTRVMSNHDIRFWIHDRIKLLQVTWFLLYSASQKAWRLRLISCISVQKVTLSTNSVLGFWQNYWTDFGHIWSFVGRLPHMFGNYNRSTPVRWNQFLREKNKSRKLIKEHAIMNVQPCNACCIASQGGKFRWEMFYISYVIFIGN